ncbi:hypothetical protein Prum_073110 [Phytohabitans rumicis]|uniref:Uncharacterized protein n=1 Tax=Phytohabitans rumicis TaxID=1076125 RepID=A0A6V8LGE6_9ACTN|nr:hypothetical protein Prum_073110 [Phytohabitans rumicis]
MRPYGRVGVGDGALDEVAVVDLRGDRHGAQPVAFQRRPDVVERAVEAGERPVEVDDGQVADGAGAVDLFEEADGRPVAFGGIAVLVGGEVPDASAEDRRVTHDSDSILVRVGRVSLWWRRR